MGIGENCPRIKQLLQNTHFWENLARKQCLSRVFEFSIRCLLHITINIVLSHLKSNIILDANKKKKHFIITKPNSSPEPKSKSKFKQNPSQIPSQLAKTQIQNIQFPQQNQKFKPNNCHKSYFANGFTYSTSTCLATITCKPQPTSLPPPSIAFCRPRACRSTSPLPYRSPIPSPLLISSRTIELLQDPYGAQSRS